jgi:hypothetical protein
MNISNERFLNNNIYNVYIALGTMPALFSQINVFLDYTPSLLWVRMCGFLDKIKEKPENIISYNEFNDILDYDFNIEYYKNIVNRLEEIIKKDKNFFFNIYIDDIRASFILKIITGLNLLTDRYSIFLIADGRLPDTIFPTLSADDENDKAEQWMQLIEFSKNKEININEINKITYDRAYAFFLSTKSNIKYLIQDFALLKNNKISDDYRNRMNICDINFHNIYCQLTNEHRNQIINSVLPADMIIKFSDYNIKHLIITGTYGFGHTYLSVFIYKSLISKVIEDYGRNYKIWFKPHPLFLLNEYPSLLVFFKQNDIEVLPEQFPLEILLWSYEYIEIGGFYCSAYTFINLKRIKFIFGDFWEYAKKYLLNEYKTYNINVSQEMAGVLWTISNEDQKQQKQLLNNFDKYDNNIIDLDHKYSTLLNQVNLLSDKIISLIDNNNNLLSNQNIINKKIYYLLIPIRPLIFIIKLCQSIYNKIKQ